MTRPSTTDQTEDVALAAAIEVVGADGAVKTEFTAIPFGDPIKGRDGRIWRMKGADHATRVLAATLANLGGVDMALNYDHQPELAVASGAGGTAPASGWVKAMRVSDQGIHVTVEWTPKAAAALAAREYRYISPSFQFDKVSGDVTRLNNIALTNNPNFDLPALAHAEQRQSGEADPMKTIALAVTALCAALALKPEDLDEAKVLAAIDQLKSGKDGAETSLAAVRAGLGVADDADQATVLASLDTVKKAGAPDPAKFVPKQGYDDLAARLAKIEDDRVLASVDAAVAAGKIAPSMKDWAIGLGKSDEQALAAFIAKAPAFDGAAQLRGDPKPAKGKLTQEEKAICSMTGVSEADFLKTRDEEAA